VLEIHTDNFEIISLQRYYPEIILLGDQYNSLAT